MCLGVPGKITEVEEGLMRMGVVDFDGSSLKVCLAYVPEAAVGDYVLVHAGFALARLDEEQARETLEILERMSTINLEPDSDRA
ncbi:MAG: HypC/HybG/HupF family hydrogenase formation chaperone [Candidatus Krumholzibacteria bacterium]|nr:HypC/HybG/HupF family hydrogenase formation chaperone [Candidatus Krumholzibacteria bacterium]